jgi:hypothetical protein
MDTSFLQDITRILTEFAATKFGPQVLEVKGPAQEGSSYRWRIVSNRFKEVTVVASTKKPPFGKPALSNIGIYGLGETPPPMLNVKDLRNFLGQAELTAVR